MRQITPRFGGRSGPRTARVSRHEVNTRTAPLPGPTSRERGAAALEMAIVAPILVLLVFGIMESGWFFAQQVELNNAAREGARLAVVDYGTAAEIADETCARASLSGANATVTVTRSTTLDPEVGDPPGTPESITVTMANNYQSLTGLLPFFDGLDMTSTVEMRTERPLETLVADGGASCP